MIVYGTDYGVVPNSPQDQCEKIHRMLEKLREIKEPCTLLFEPGTYILGYKRAPQIVAYITNTASEKENPDVRKTVGIYIDGHKNLTIDGQDSTFVFQGKMTECVIQHSTNICLKNMRFDYERPTVSEFTVVNKGLRFMDIQIHPKDWYRIQGRRIQWYGHNWTSTGTLCVAYFPEEQRCRRVGNPLNTVWKIQELESHKLRLHYLTPYIPMKMKIGHVFQVRDGIRDQVGVWINRSEDVTIEGAHISFMHGLGIVAQQSHNVTLKHVNLMPDKAGGRTCAAFADFFHVSGCSGKIHVESCCFNGAHDDGINVHGTHLKVVEKVDARSLKVRYMHPQTYGFMPYKPGDQVALVDSRSLQRYGFYQVATCKQESKRVYCVEFTEKIKQVVRSTVMENLSEQSEVLIENSIFMNIPTRGILLTNGKKGVVRNNEFLKTGMSGILMSDDGRSWYESGATEDVTIEANIFQNCGVPMIAVKPENTRDRGPIHKNIRVQKNIFYGQGKKGNMYFKGVEGLVIEENKEKKGEKRGKKI